MKRSVSTVLALMMLLTMIPTAAFAETSLTQLSAPTDLQWGIAYDEDGDAYDTNAVGTISFRGELDIDYEIAVYRKDAVNGDTQIYGISSQVDDPGLTYSNDLFMRCPDELITGTYYFTVQAKGDGVKTSDSEIETSSDWSYTRPEIVLNVSEPKWGENYTVTWTNGFDNDTYVDFYNIHFYHNTVNDASTAKSLGGWGCTPDELPYTIDTDALEEGGDGYYFFRLRAESSDPNMAVPGTWTERSDGVYYTAPTDKEDAPTDLQWGIEYDYDGNVIDTNAIGAISFKGELGVDYNIAVYRKDAENGDERIYRTSGQVDDPGLTYSTSLFMRCPDEMINGTYYFTVQALGDQFTTLNSDVIKSEEWEYSAPTQKANAPYELQWGIEYDYDGNVIDTNAIGAISFKGELDIDYEIAVYRKDAEDGDERIYRTKGNVDDPGLTYSTGLFMRCPNEMITGTYYFTVQALGDQITTLDSDVIQSGEWVYTQPELVLNVSDPKWGENYTATWTNKFADETYVDYYAIEIYHNTVNEVETAQWINCWFRSPDNLPFKLPADAFAEGGEGYYYFRVRAETNDPYKAITGSWSEMSDGIQYTAPTQKAAAPYDLKWDIGYNGDGSTNQLNGCCSFKGEPDMKYTLKIYRKDAEGNSVEVAQYWEVTCDCGNNTAYSISPFYTDPDVMTTGTYYFTVQALGDGITTVDSDVIISEDWEYTRPELSLEISTPTWGEDFTLTWTNEFEDEALVREYHVVFYYSDTNDPDTAVVYHRGRYYTPGNEPFEVPDEVFEVCGNKYYFFKVRAYSDDPLAAAAGAWSGLSEGVYYSAPEKVKAPTNLQWGVEYDEYGNVKDADAAGFISFKGEWNTDYDITLYRKDAVNGNEQIYFFTGTVNDIGLVFSINLFHYCPEEQITGTYYFTVQAKGDGNATVDSEIVTSSDWAYTRPELQLNVLDPHWDEGYIMTWTSSFEDSSLVKRYNVRFYRSDTNDVNAATPVKNGAYWGLGANNTSIPTEVFTYIPTEVFGYGGDGYYFFQVRAVSNDLNEACDGDWSELSDGVLYTAPDLKLDVSDPYWDEGYTMAWTNAFEDETYVDYYNITFYYCETNDANAAVQTNNGQGWRFQPEDAPFTIPADVLAYGGDGYYFFKVKAVTGDVSMANTGDWSELSAACYMVYDSAITVTAENEGLNVKLNTASAFPMLCAAYTEQGQMLGIATLKADALAATISCNAEDVAYVTLFLVKDTDTEPISVPITIQSELFVK